MEAKKSKLYKLLYEWFVDEMECCHCKHSDTFREGDLRHPCNKCSDSCDKFKVSDAMKGNIQKRVKQIMEIME